jgi:hypothetical protein
MADYGNVYFYNMTDQTLTVELNDAVEGNLVIDAMEHITADDQKAGGKEYKISFKTVPRDSNPSPYQRAVFGVKNKIKFWLAKDKNDARVVNIEIDKDKPGYHLNLDLQIYVFYDILILRVEGNALTYKAGKVKTETAQTDANRK